MSEKDNVCRWDGRSRGHYEVWYLTMNDRKSGTGYWIRYTLEAPLAEVGDPYAQLWFATFDAGAPARTFWFNRKFPIDALSLSASPFRAAIGDSYIEHDGMRGHLAGDGHEASWELTWAPAPTTTRQLPPVFYRRGGLGDTTLLSPNVDVPVSGVLEVDGRRFELDGEPGGQTHLWGRKHARAWAWGHCNAFEGRPGAALETLTARLERRGVVLPPLTVLTLHLDGETHRMNRVRSIPFNRGSWDTGLYRFSAAGARIRIEGEYRCRPEQMVVAEYADPDGEPSYCSNTEVADLRVTVYERSSPLGAWRERERLLAPRTGHFEIGGRERDPAVEKDHVPI
jgi:hypothetical protein